jgi:hypothetical protein
MFGVGGPTFSAITNFLLPAWNDQMPVDQAIKQFDDELEKFVQQQG